MPTVEGKAGISKVALPKSVDGRVAAGLGVGFTEAEELAAVEVGATDGGVVVLQPTRAATAIAAVKRCLPISDSPFCQMVVEGYDTKKRRGKKKGCRRFSRAFPALSVDNSVDNPVDFLWTACGWLWTEIRQKILMWKSCG
ncbi:hypothetical protein [Catelliglobosispora koreensis]|uniref:hypothetical protein n=1 Tax=Catelliglobosispora koreensis TaxID=129052 RepID=UPI0012FB9C34|nr:hypothetical protein [Catelliglobosispora koreensis]